MHFISSYRDLRSVEKEASSTSISSTAQLSKEAISSHKKNNPKTYFRLKICNKGFL